MIFIGISVAYMNKKIVFNYDFRGSSEYEIRRDDKHI